MIVPVTDSKPWYKQLWPWLIISLPASAVIAGLTTLYIAIENQDPLVKDDWYKEGKAINRRVELDRVAFQLGVKANLTVDDITGDVLLTLSSKNQSFNYPQKLYVEFIHPTIPERDQRIPLLNTQSHRYHGNLQKALKGKHHINLSNSPFLTRSAMDNNGGSTLLWRLKKTSLFPLRQPLLIESL